MIINPPGYGSVAPSNGTTHYYTPNTVVTISATQSSGHAFVSWTGYGAGSYTGTNQTQPIIIANEIMEEVANFK